MHGQFFTLEMANKILADFERFKAKNTDPKTGMIKTNCSMFDYTTLAAALSKVKSCA